MNKYRFFDFRDLSNFEHQRTLIRLRERFPSQLSRCTCYLYDYIKKGCFYFFDYLFFVWGGGYFGALSGCVFFVFERTTCHIFWHRTYFWQILFLGLVIIFIFFRIVIFYHLCEREGQWHMDICSCLFWSWSGHSQLGVVLVFVFLWVM